MVIIASTIYALAMTGANLSIAYFGVWVSPINSFLFIGLDLALRDVLHTRLSKYQMLGLIVLSGLITYALNPSAGMIAIASASAFTLAALADWSTFSVVKGSWMKRSNSSNTVGAAVDSIAFPTIAFGVLMPHIIALQFVAKVVGGFVWSLLLSRIVPQLQNEES